MVCLYKQIGFFNNFQPFSVCPVTTLHNFSTPQFVYVPRYNGSLSPLVYTMEMVELYAVLSPLILSPQGAELVHVWGSVFLQKFWTSPLRHFSRATALLSPPKHTFSKCPSSSCMTPTPLYGPKVLNKGQGRLLMNKNTVFSKPLLPKSVEGE